MSFRRVNYLIVASALALALSACSPDETDGTVSGSDRPAAQTTAQEAATDATADMADLTEGVEGQVGFRHGMDCEDVNNCSVNFTVEALEVLDTCPGYGFGTQPEDTQLVRATVLLETRPSTTEYDPTLFPAVAQWSAADSEGVNQQMHLSDWCSPDNNQTTWGQMVHLGDTVRMVHLMDVPVGSSEIRLTETINGSRWIFESPTNVRL